MYTHTNTYTQTQTHTHTQIQFTGTRTKNCSCIGWPVCRTGLINFHKDLLRKLETERKTKKKQKKGEGHTRRTMAKRVPQGSRQCLGLEWVCVGVEGG